MKRKMYSLLSFLFFLSSKKLQGSSEGHNIQIGREYLLSFHLIREVTNEELMLKAVSVQILATRESARNMLRLSGVS